MTLSWLSVTRVPLFSFTQVFVIISLICFVFKFQPYSVFIGLVLSILVVVFCLWLDCLWSGLL